MATPSRNLVLDTAGRSHANRPRRRHGREQVPSKMGLGERDVERDRLSRQCDPDARSLGAEQPNISTLAERQGVEVAAQMALEQWLSRRDDRAPAGPERCDQLRLGSGDL